MNWLWMLGGVAIGVVAVFVWIAWVFRKGLWR